MVLGKSVFEIPIPIIIMVLVIIVSCFILYKTKCGRYIYAIGGNMQASYLSGINTKLMTIFVYAFAGPTASIAAIIMDARLNAAAPTAGENYELNAIAAVVIGGTSMAGGEGKISGTIDRCADHRCHQQWYEPVKCQPGYAEGCTWMCYGYSGNHGYAQKTQ